jgi:hypothetical protein
MKTAPTHKRRKARNSTRITLCYRCKEMIYERDGYFLTAAGPKSKTFLCGPCADRMDALK